jgi:uncharacterized Ntn-hydrolase superfamily protein
MTFSLIARCPETLQFGMVISSSSPAVAARCLHLRAGVGAVASQNITDPALGPLVLDALAAGQSPAAALKALQARPHLAYRQLLAIGRTGAPAIHSGPNVLGLWGEAMGPDCAAGGNLLATPDVPQAMVAAFQSSTGLLADRLMTALQAGLDAGGEAGPVHSAGMAVVDQLDWRLVDLRIDWHGTPIEALTEAWQVYRPQMQAYVQRALDPSQAPSYGVPGDE